MKQFGPAPRQEINIPKITDKITFKRMVAIRDAVEYMEEDNPGDDVIALLGQLNLYEDGTMVFTWKGKDLIVFAPLRLDDEDHIVFEYDKIYLAENNDREF